jgi:hypothetical protein
MKKITLMAVMLLFSALSFAQVNLANGLIAYYPYNGNADDASGNGFNGTVGSGVSLTADRFGNANKAYNFPNNGSIASIIQCDSDSSFSIVLWFRADQITVNTTRLLLWRGDLGGPTPTGEQTSFGISNAGSACYANLEKFNGQQGCSLLNSSESNPAPFDDANWYMATISKNGNQVIFYINDVPQDTITVAWSTAPCNSVNIDYISFTMGSDVFNGAIDDVMVYNRALNTAEVDSIHALTASYLTPTSTSILDGALDINVFPNPFNNLANISFPENGIYNIQVVDMTGRLIYTAQVSDQNLQLNTSSWAAGMYRLNIFSEKGQFESKTIVKE